MRCVCGFRAVLASLAIAVFGAIGCGDPPPSEYPTKQAWVEDTTLGPGDVFEVRVFDQEDLSGPYSVTAGGTITFPLIGELVVAGKTPPAVETEIRERLADGYLQDPQVSILVKEYRSKKISVLGQVRQPGTFPFTDGMTIVEAISIAGGFTPMARRNAVVVTRSHGERQNRFTVAVEKIGKGQAENFTIRPGDVVFVPDRPW